MSELKEGDFALMEKLTKNFTESLLKEIDDEHTFSLELRTPDKIINELKFKNKNLSETIQKQKIYLIILGIVLLLTITVSLIIFIRGNNYR